LFCPLKFEQAVLKNSVSSDIIGDAPYLPSAALSYIYYLLVEVNNKMCKYGRNVGAGKVI
jgi:hypothetical protein